MKLHAGNIMRGPPDTVGASLTVNALGAARLCEALSPPRARRPPALVRCLLAAWLSSLTMAGVAQAQRAPTTDGAAADTATTGADQPALPPASAVEGESAQSEKKTGTADKDLIDRIWGVLSQEEDPDGPINTDRPTFTPANTVVPPGRLQFESGWTFNYLQARAARNEVYDLPELAMRYGVADRVEFRTFWQGETWDSAQLRRGGTRSPGGVSDMEVGFKWQVLVEDKKKKWRPTTALITSIIAPTGGSSALSGETVEPYINLIYAWSLTDKLTFGGSTGYLGIRQQASPGASAHSDNYQRFHQSLVSFYAVTERATLFYEWYIWTFTNSPDNRPLNFMDGGILYRLTPNMQVDIRAGFGLSGRPDDFFTGTGFSVRF
jgi:hypothetical protein